MRYPYVNVRTVDVMTMNKDEAIGYKIGEVIGVLIQAYLLYCILHWLL